MTRRDLSLLKSGFKAAPARYRNCATDVHEAHPAEDFGPSNDLLPAGYTGTKKDYLALLKTQRAQAKAAARLPKKAESKPPVTYSSVFQPRLEQKHVCDLATMHRKKLMTSEWALLDTLEVQMYNDERDKSEQIKSLKAAQQRAFLEMQFKERQREEKEAKVVQLKEDAEMLASVEEMKRVERQKFEATRAANIKAKKEKLAMLAEARQAHEEAKIAKREEEKKMLQQIKEAMEQDQAMKEEKVRIEKEHNEKTRRDNEVKLAAKKEEHQKQKAAEVELMKLTLETLEKQDKAREAALKDFHEKIQARGAKSVQKAIEEKRDRQEREERLMKEREMKMEADAQAKVEQEKKKREQQKAMILASREEALAEKTRRLAASQEEKRRQREEAEAVAIMEKEKEYKKMAAIRARAAETRGVIESQLTQRELQLVDEDTGMTEAEKRINAKLLEQARRVVGSPKPLTMKRL